MQSAWSVQEPQGRRALTAGRVEGHLKAWPAGHAAGQADVNRIVDANGRVVYDGVRTRRPRSRETSATERGRGTAASA